MTTVFAHTYFNWYEILSRAFGFMHCNRELAVNRSRYFDWFRMQESGRVCSLEVF